ncbi:MAG: endonuclease/exonuclease/phosphatase family protein [Clostridia bacterium]|nr:endonuclease/exonuclease/phosphatase family protein [Clostridia bacterium]
MKRIRLFLRLLALVLALFLLPALCAAETDADDPALAEGADIRVMSYNVMHPEWEHVPVQGRDEKVAAILMYYMPDVVALQEANVKWQKALIPYLVDTGAYGFACRVSNAPGLVYSTTCFMYNTRTLNLVEERVLDVEMRDSTRVFAVAVFETLADGKRFVVTNTHPAPREQAAKYERNIAYITALAAETAKQYAGLPLIMAGDFNTPEQADAYVTLMNEAGVRDAKYAASVLVRDYPTYFGYQVFPNTDNMDHCVDHLFVNDAAEVKLFNAVIGHDVQNASDHIPIYADISLN